MKTEEIPLKLTVRTRKAVKDIEKATKAADKLNKALEKLQNISIEVAVIEVKKRWWQFWK